jgi:DHA1 family bicyclomycin/chloramphenicol resistance-like MFS transporter
MKVPRWLPLLLGFLQAIGPISIDMYLPAFPAIEAEFHAPQGSAQLTLATWILGLSFGQLAQGAMADRFGRRVPLVVGMALYTIASAGCALAPSIAWLAVWRFVAALGGSASMIVPRAVVRDVAEGHNAARMMSRLILVLGAAPILAPSLGGLVLQFATWRGIFWITTGYGALGLVLAAAFLPDTLPPARRVRLHLASMLVRYGQILTERVFITHTLMLSASSFALFAYLAGSPTVFIEHFRLTPAHYAVLFGMVAATYVLFSQLNVLVTRRLGLDGTLRVATTVYVALGAVLLALAVSGRGGALAMAAVLALMQGQSGFIAPTGMVGALHRHAAHAGSASALMGTLQFAIGCSAGFLTAWLTDGTALPMAGLMAGGALCCKLADLCRPRAG